MNEEEASLFDVLWLLLASVIFVPIFQKIPGGDINIFSIKISLYLYLVFQCEISNSFFIIISLVPLLGIFPHHIINYAFLKLSIFMSACCFPKRNWKFVWSCFTDCLLICNSRQSCPWIPGCWHLDWPIWSLYHPSCAWYKGDCWIWSCFLAIQYWPW
jgi:hypothetical protein